MWILKRLKNKEKCASEMSPVALFLFQHCNYTKKNIFLRISLRVTIFQNAMFWDSSLYLPKVKLFNFLEFYFAFKLQMSDKKERKKKQDKTNNEKQSKILIFFHYIHESHVIISNNLFSYFLSFVKRTKGLFKYTNITGFIKP